MLTNSTLSRITADAEAYAKKYNHFKDTTFAGMERQTYVEAASAEAERAQGLVECLEKIRKHPMTPHYMLADIDEALNKYNNSK